MGFNTDSHEYVIGPFAQVVTMHGLPASGPIDDSLLTIKADAAIHVRGDLIVDILPFNAPEIRHLKHLEMATPCVAMPGFIDTHTHLCFAGSRAADYTRRLSGISYRQIAMQGGGILSTVIQTQAASQPALVDGLIKRLKIACQQGVTTCEVKSGYGLNTGDEIKMLQAINQASQQQAVSLIPTCLAAHALPKEFPSATSYLDHLGHELLPKLIQQKLCRRIDIFVDSCAFTIAEARPFLARAKQMDFAIIVHADQFARGGAKLAADIGALSADHLEVSTPADAALMKASGVIPIVLPASSLGLGLPFAPARMLLDAGLPLVIASDWNPGSAPSGRLLMAAAFLGAAQHLTMAETFAALTVRAAKALELNDRGMLQPGKRADIIVFPVSDMREILYQQGALLPCTTLIGGKPQ